MNKRCRLGVVIVSYNRLSCLKNALASFAQQTQEPSFVLVVDNASSDGTHRFLDEWVMDRSSCCERYVLREEENCGGSGGFYDGLKRAMELGADWVWLSDDDAYPEKRALEFVYEHIDDASKSEIAAVCGAVLNKGSVDTRHRRWTTVKKLKVCENQVPAAEYKSQFELNTFSFVGTVVNRYAVEKVGLPKREYFIWYDDTEYSLRLSKVGKVVCCPEIRITHDVSESNDVFTWKGYYGQRNCLDMIHEHFSALVYQYACLRAMLKAKRLLKTIGPDIGRMYKEAIHDQCIGRFGVHDTYKPGWKPSSR